MKNNNQRKNKINHNVTERHSNEKPPHEINCISGESYHKLNRVIAVTKLVRFSMLKSEIDTATNCGVQQLLSYFNDDIRYVLHDLESSGLCDKWLQQSVKN
ncbi:MULTISPECIES: hypothetical protein [Serratia]|uniref:Derepression protein n=2 Tax=Serratia TaxID=613 RepID=A0A9X8VJK8_SERMA|nr:MULTISPECIES: hypothetical protein [Serratia]MBS3893600.1 hypothetical protein [Serratia marcescens]TXE26699.1 hypothetical protein FOT63_20035 [Serratia ureilytica]